MVARIVEIAVFDGLLVAFVGHDAPPVLVNLPKLHLVVHSPGEQQVSRLGKPFDAGNGFGVPLPLMDLALGYEAFDRGLLRLQVDSNILRSVRSGK